MVASVLVTIALFAMTAELVAYLHHQANDKARATAVRLMSTSLEKARGLDAATLASLSGGSAPYVDHGMTFTQTEAIERCLVTDAANACTATGHTAANTDTRVRITVT